ncbi:hypothetical protein PUNSTDRAFT_145950 [Punctularia strigosozonata HHB-11173 SS5]|uniref:uncharacterized protein n=1 Tax=Punctularia strigosozonata (strain HHB-11173) TaxID=741275 RepID=UPI00044180D2|nr:uncharacterized protein PUNSTDRAFT_145950 [Punctularia strigosozonata HHB-11173 SS5]EIN05572.1 hypothetical protein PUNSTDRAFT_145950 [Punctularia strigosozonata HHB-11173 SS5]
MEESPTALASSVGTTDGGSLPSSPEDTGNWHRSLQIDMKGLVGDAVGNMSISPTSRDVVLAARRGLYIIDLEAPFEVPRFIPQGGTWDVADVQWNPHVSRAEYIVSTSSEKLLIWNLMQTGPTSIQHVLQFHYRAITDINWHTSEPDVVVSTGIDSWLWAWDLRQPPHKPVLGFSAFEDAGTQVKWNRQDPHILASSHGNAVLIWDRRKGSLPVSRTVAHAAKIYGIDWSHTSRRELITCSLDKTIKVWDCHLPAAEQAYVHADSRDHNGQLRMTINTGYPVWRARDLPFGKGILSLPQRGETALEMWSHADAQQPVEAFEGHTDVVKEFVWRRGQNTGDFQLITWSKDRTLRFWPIEPVTMESVGCTPPNHPEPRERPKDTTVSFRTVPEPAYTPPAITAPVGNLGILDQVRATLPGRQMPHSQRSKAIGSAVKLSPTQHRRIGEKHPRWDDDSTFGSVGGKTVTPGSQSTPIAIASRKGPTMSRGNFGGKSAKIEPTTWFTSLKVGAKRDSSGGPPSGESGNVSRTNSRSRPPSLGQADMPIFSSRRRSGSRDDEPKELDTNSALHEEISAVVTKLKVKFDNPERQRKRTFTFGLHGPWGQSGSVFFRVTFSFPRGYPQDGIPTVDLEKHSSISLRNQRYMLARVREILQQERPCLEPALRFLLYADANDPHPTSDVESSDDDHATPKSQKDKTFTLIRNVKNLAEPRTSQGTFSVGGQFVCFFRAPPRIVRNALQDLSMSSSNVARPEETPRMFQSPALLSDAVRLLSLAANDRNPYRDARMRHSKHAEENEHKILTVMTNLLSGSQVKLRRFSEIRPPLTSNYSLFGHQLLSVVHIRDVSDITRMDQECAAEYGFGISALGLNAASAQALGRPDHERIFRMVEAIATIPKVSIPSGRVSRAPVIAILLKIYEDVATTRDIHILAILATVLLEGYHISASGQPSYTQTPRPASPTSGQDSPRTPPGDYFSDKKDNRSKQHAPNAKGTGPARMPPQAPSSAPPLSPSNSSRGSWSSLFSTSHMRQLVAGGPAADSDDVTTPTAAAIPVPGGGLGRRRRESDSPIAPGFVNKDSPSTAPQSSSGTKSWNEMALGAVVALAASQKKAPAKSKNTKAKRTEKRICAVLPPASTPMSIFTVKPELREQLVHHIIVYANILFSWGLLDKRAEILKFAASALQTSPDRRPTSWFVEKEALSDSSTDDVPAMTLTSP